MLHTFLTANRADLIERCRLKAAQRRAPAQADAQLEHGVPLFLDQLIETLHSEESSNPTRDRSVCGPPAGATSVPSEIAAAAAQHGHELLRSGLPVGQVVHAYGDLCQAITELAFERRELIVVDEFRTLNRCLDNAIADAVTEFVYQRDFLKAEIDDKATNERVGSLVHELRNHIHVASLAFAALKVGSLGLTGATGSVLDRSLMGLRTLVEQALDEVRGTPESPAQHQLICVADFIAEVKVAASLQAGARDCAFTVATVDPKLAVDADRGLLFSAVENVLQNAFKFTLPHSAVSLHAYAAADRIRIDVEDACGGLAPGDEESMFLPFSQRGADKSGLGLGLSICRRSVEANDGTLSVRDVPGSGCVFTIDLPRHELS